MVKRVMFIGVLTLVVTSAASAGFFDQFGGFLWTDTTPNSQQQAFIGGGGQIAGHMGAGVSAGTNTNGAGSTQAKTTPVGTGIQNTSLGNTQSSYVYTGPRSAGMTYSDAWFATYQGQFFLY